MEADLMRVDAMEDQEVTSRLQAGFTMGELQRSAIPNSVIPSNVKFLSYENMRRSVSCSPAAMKHPWVQGALAVTGKLHKEIMDLKQQVNKLEEENRILRGNHRQEYYANNKEGDIITWVWALPLATAKLGGGALVSYHHNNSYLYRFS